VIELADLRPLFVIIHLLGIILGAGSGFVVDALFLTAVRDRKLTRERVRTIGLGSRMVWLGVALIVASGALMVYLNPDRTLGNPKFLAKMTAVAVLIANGTFFHFVHYPRMVRKHSRLFSSAREFLENTRWLFISGALSAPSWLTALVLGSLRRLEYSYWFYIGIYGGILAGAVISSLLLRRLAASRLSPGNRPNGSASPDPA